MFTARCVDAEERKLVAQGDAFFHVSGAGHEATAALARYLTPEDYLHWHYRDKALMLARGIPVVEFFNNLLCNSAGASAGRQMSAHLCDRSRRIEDVEASMRRSHI
jgi:2-oxoisovalerate dehydrogenase E1 component